MPLPWQRSQRPTNGSRPNGWNARSQKAQTLTSGQRSQRPKCRACRLATWSICTSRLAILKAACRWAWRKHGLCESAPTTRMQMPAVRNERHVYATRRQMLTLARAADRHDVRVLIRTAFYTGMRLGELMRVEVAGGALHLADTKNGERRSIPAHRAIQTCLRYLPLTAGKRTLQAGFLRARRAVGLDHIRIHDLRHSAASEMINADVDLFTVGAVLGHKDPRSTQRYAHLKHETLADAVGKIGRKDPHKDHPKAA